MLIAIREVDHRCEPARASVDALAYVREHGTLAQPASGFGIARKRIRPYRPQTNGKFSRQLAGRSHAGCSGPSWATAAQQRDGAGPGWDGPHAEGVPLSEGHPFWTTRLPPAETLGFVLTVTLSRHYGFQDRSLINALGQTTPRQRSAKTASTRDDPVLQPQIVIFIDERIAVVGIDERIAVVGRRVHEC